MSDPSLSADGSDPSPSDRCTARNRRGEPCSAYPVRGATVCAAHGGRAPQVRAAAARRLQRERLNGDLGRLLEELEVDASNRHPVEVLLDAVARTWGMVQVLGALVGGLRTEGPAFTDDDGGDVGRLWGLDHRRDGAPHVLSDMYATWLDRAIRTSKLAIDAGVDERRVQLAQRLAGTMTEVLQAVLADLDLTPAQRQVAAVAIPRHLRAAAALNEGEPS